MSEPADELRNDLLFEARLVEKRASITARNHFTASVFWNRVQLAVGGLAAVLSAIAGASALSSLPDGAIVAGALALAVTTLTSVATFLNPSERANAHLRAGNAYLALENDARLFYKLDLWSSKSERDLKRVLTRLVTEQNNLNTTSPQPPNHVKKRHGTVAERLADEPVEA